MTEKSSSPVIDYARPPLDELWRDGNLLVAYTGVDLSKRCACCGKKSTGEPVVWRLYERAGASELFDGWWLIDPEGAVAMLCLGLIWVFAISHRRTITLGLCSDHAEKGRRFRATMLPRVGAAAACVLVGALVLVLGFHGSIGIEIAVISFVLAAVVGGSALFTFAGGIPVSLVKYRDNRLWISGVDASLLTGLPALPIEPAWRK